MCNILTVDQSYFENACSCETDAGGSRTRPGQDPVVSGSGTRHAETPLAPSRIVGAAVGAQCVVRRVSTGRARARHRRRLLARHRANRRHHTLTHTRAHFSSM